MKFDKIKLIQGLKELPQRFRTTFAVASAQRIYETYALTHSIGSIKIEALDEVLSKLWADLLEQKLSFSIEEANKWLEIALQLPETDGIIAEDAIAAITYSIQCHIHDGDVNEAILPANREYDLLDREIINMLNIDITIKENWRTIEEHPLDAKWSSATGA